MRTKQKSAFADRKMLGRAMKDSFVKLSPKTQAKNPVMFLVFVSAILTSILWVVSLFGLKDAPSGYTMAIAIILLDYIIAYTVVGLSSMFGSSRPAIIGGVAVTLGLRFLCHFLTGWMIWDALWPNEFGMTSAVYSLWYNGSYMLPEIVITAVLACILVPWVNKTFPCKK